MDKAALFRTVAVLGAALALAGCGSGSSIVADDAALCRFAAAPGSADSYAQCRNRLAGRQQIMAAAGASRIEGYALLNTPAPASVNNTAAMTRRRIGDGDWWSLVNAFKSSILPKH